MIFRLRQFWVLTRLTALEVLRQPLCLLLAAGAVVLMALASLQAFHFGEDGRLARDSALAVHFVFGLLLGVYAACTSLPAELRSGTALAVLSKPVSREVFFLAKFGGAASVVLLFSACASAATLLSEKAAPKLYRGDPLALAVLLGAPVLAFAVAAFLNAAARRPFASTAFLILAAALAVGLALAAAFHDPASEYRWARGHRFHVAAALQWRILPASLLVTLAVLVLSALGLALATRLETVPVLTLGIAALLAGLLADSWFGRGTVAGAALRPLLPDWQPFWAADRLVAGGTVPWARVGTAAAYAACWLAVFLSAGAWSFGRREVR